MTTFILSQEPEIKINGKSQAGRVILDRDSHGTVIRCIDANDVTRIIQTPDGPVEKIIKSAWCVAREKVDESGFYHIDGEGWFPRKAIEQRAA